MKIKITPLRFVTPLIAAAGLATILVTGCTGSSTPSHGPATTEAQAQHKAVEYTCSMHPEVIQNAPGNCPKCGMKLAERP